jgi:integrase
MAGAKQTVRLTKRVVEAIKPPPADALPAELWDAEIKGFHVRVPASGRAVYRFFYRAAGAQKVITLGAHGVLTCEQARERALSLAGAVAAGRDPVAEQKAAQAEQEEAARRAMTVGELIDLYLSEGPRLNPAKRARSWQHDRSCLEAHVRPLLGMVQIGNVRRGDVQAMVAKIIAGKTARREKLGLRAVRIVKGGEAAARAAAVAAHTLFAFAVDRELIPRNPVEGVKKPAAGKRERFLSEAEAGRLFETIAAMVEAGELHGVFADTLRLIAFTGARRGEIEGLRWAEVDFDRSEARLPAHRSKTGAKTIPLSAPALALLAERARTSVYVFPSPMGGDGPANALSKNWQRVRARAGLDGVRVHDLRHTMASLLVARGASLPMIGKILGHTNAATTARYAHLQTDPLRALVDEAANALQGRRQADQPPADIVRLPRQRKESKP